MKTKMDREKLALIIPTKDRPDKLRGLLESIYLQKTRPTQIIIVDGGGVSARGVLAAFSNLNINYLQAECSLPVQRNSGLNLLRKEITLVAFFDDDIELCPNTVDVVMEFWAQANANISGVACNNISHPRHKVLFLEKVFLLGSERVGAVLPSGFQSKICSVNNNYQVQWLMGGATFWRRSIFNQYRFDEWFYGYAHCEDIDFSYRLAKKYKLFVLKDARVIHRISPLEKKYEYRLGIMQVVNRVYFVKKHPELSLLLCYWSCLGLCLKNIFLGTIGRQPRYLLRAWGILSGIIISFFKPLQVKERIK